MLKGRYNTGDISDDDYVREQEISLNSRTTHVRYESSNIVKGIDNDIKKKIEEGKIYMTNISPTKNAEIEEAFLKSLYNSKNANNKNNEKKNKSLNKDKLKNKKINEHNEARKSQTIKNDFPKREEPKVEENANKGYIENVQSAERVENLRNSERGENMEKNKMIEVYDSETPSDSYPAPQNKIINTIFNKKNIDTIFDINSYSNMFERETIKYIKEKERKLRKKRAHANLEALRLQYIPISNDKFATIPISIRENILALFACIIIKHIDSFDDQDIQKDIEQLSIKFLKQMSNLLQVDPLAYQCIIKPFEQREIIMEVTGNKKIYQLYEKPFVDNLLKEIKELQPDINRRFKNVVDELTNEMDFWQNDDLVVNSSIPSKQYNNIMDGNEDIRNFYGSHMFENRTHSDCNSDYCSNDSNTDNMFCKYYNNDSDYLVGSFIKREIDESYSGEEINDYFSLPTNTNEKNDNTNNHKNVDDYIAKEYNSSNKYTEPMNNIKHQKNNYYDKVNQTNEDTDELSFDLNSKNTFDDDNEKSDSSFNNYMVENHKKNMTSQVEIPRLYSSSKESKHSKEIKPPTSRCNSASIPDSVKGSGIVENYNRATSKGSEYNRADSKSFGYKRATSKGSEYKNITDENNLNKSDDDICFGDQERDDFLWDQNEEITSINENIIDKDDISSNIKQEIYNSNIIDNDDIIGIKEREDSNVLNIPKLNTKQSNSSVETIGDLYENDTNHQSNYGVPTKGPEAKSVILRDLITTYIMTGNHNARIQLYFHRFAKCLKINELLILRIEENLASDLINALQPSTNESTKNKHIRRIKIAAAALGGGALVAFTAGLAAPGIVAGLIALGAGGSGVTTFLSTAGGLAFIVSLFGAGGAGLTGYKYSRRIANIKIFEFLMLNGNISKSLSVAVCVSGEIQTDDDITLPWINAFPSPYCDLYALKWENHLLKTLGSLIETMLSQEFAITASKIWLQYTIASTLSAALAWPLALIKYASNLDNVYLVIRERAQQAGRILAEALSDRNTVGQRPVILIGYSVGARVIFYCLKYLYAKKLYNIVSNAIFIGLPATTSTRIWSQIRMTVTNRVVNVYSKNDWLLGFLYRYMEWKLNVAGLMPINDPGIENYDASGIIHSHLDYKRKLKDIFRLINFDM
ncbi:conserved protein, unknown function [Plasmodium vinckei vinckei]|uniref:DUF726 domain-containing protein n=1 Tax=Plasmodium vinckei vinckei TaxID=54757 RepID=A0A449BPW9_PLAVN|nr:conserved protein, unknown function [Plasmodium vinckei vinckei]VEV55428.1 conserved protein, unknown function [Plasmodium vinckei vinckei]